MVRHFLISADPALEAGWGRWTDQVSLMVPSLPARVKNLGLMEREAQG